MDDDNLKFLKTFVLWLQNWNSVTVQSFLSEHLLTSYTFKYVLLAKFQTDALEGRFGLYKQMNEANYHVSVTEILQSEKKK